MPNTFTLVLLIFGYMVFSCAVLGLITWGLVALIPPEQEKHPELQQGLRRLGVQWLGVGALSLALGVLSLPGISGP